MKTPTIEAVAKPTSELVEITPEIAALWLSKNRDNQRNVTRSHVMHFAKEMIGGRWIVTGQPIIFDANDHMIDGQHRLHAIVLSGVSVTMMVTRGVAESAFMAIDRGKPRTSGNIFAIRGIKDCNQVASICNNVWKYRRAIKTSGSVNTYDRASAAELLDVFDANPDGYYASLAPAGAVNRVIGLQPSVAGACHFIASEIPDSSEEVALFFEGLVSGSGLMEGSPILYLRNTIIRSDKSRLKMGAMHMFALTAKAWNLFRKSKSAKLIKYQDGEAFPEFI